MNGFIGPFKDNFDRWTWEHLLGPYIIADLVTWGAYWINQWYLHYFWQPWLGLGVATFFYVFWEFLDYQLYRLIGTEASMRIFMLEVEKKTLFSRIVIFLDKYILDRRGISWGDLSCGLISTTLWLLIHLT